MPTATTCWRRCCCGGGAATPDWREAPMAPLGERSLARRRSSPRSSSRPTSSPSKAGSIACATWQHGPRQEDRRRAGRLQRAARRSSCCRRTRDAARRRATTAGAQRSSPSASARGSAPGTRCSRARPAPIPARSATFEEAERRLPYIASMGFDVVYLPPIHPIGTQLPQGAQQCAHGRSRAIRAARGPSAPPTAATRPSSPGLGTLADFDRFVGPRRDASARDRARHRLPGLARSPLRHGTSGVVPASPRRHDQVRGEPAEEIPGHLPVRLRVGGLAGAVARAEGGDRVLDRARRDASSASTTRTPSRSASGSGRSARSARRIRTRSSWPRRSRGRRSCGTWRRSASRSRTPTSPGGTRRRSSRSTSPS